MTKTLLPQDFTEDSFQEWKILEEIGFHVDRNQMGVLSFVQAYQTGVITLVFPLYVRTDFLVYLRRQRGDIVRTLVLHRFPRDTSPREVKKWFLEELPLLMMECPAF